LILVVVANRSKFERKTAIQSQPLRLLADSNTKSGSAKTGKFSVGSPQQSDMQAVNEAATIMGKEGNNNKKPVFKPGESGGTINRSELSKIGNKSNASKVVASTNLGKSVDYSRNGTKDITSGGKQKVAEKHGTQMNVSVTTKLDKLSQGQSVNYASNGVKDISQMNTIAGNERYAENPVKNDIYRMNTIAGNERYGDDSGKSGSSKQPQTKKE
jgi:hypothetical protein